MPTYTLSVLRKKRIGTPSDAHPTSIKIFLPDLPLIFEIENPQEDCFAAIREKIIRYLEKNPHQFNADKIKAREK